MRKSLASTGFALVIAIAATLHSQPEPRRTNHAINQRHNNYYYKSYDMAYRPACLARTVTPLDYSGKAIQKAVRPCGQRTTDR